MGMKKEDRQAGAFKRGERQHRTIASKSFWGGGRLGGGTPIVHVSHQKKKKRRGMQRSENHTTAHDLGLTGREENWEKKLL